MLEAVKDAPLNVLHLHGDAVYLDAFYSGWPAAVINYSTHGTEGRYRRGAGRYAGVIAGGIDETAYRTLDAAALRAQAEAARPGRRAVHPHAGLLGAQRSPPAELHKLHRLFAT